MADLPEGTDRATLVRVKLKEPVKGHEKSDEFVVGAAYVEAFSDEVEFLRFADESEETAAAREKASKAEAKASGGTQRGPDTF